MHFSESALHASRARQEYWWLKWATVVALAIGDRAQYSPRSDSDSF